MSIISHIFDLVMLIGAAVLAVFAYRSGRSKSAQVPADAVLIDSVRADIAEQGETRQGAIQDALTGENPADDLARLGNERRS